ncbi:hypothetical protein [Streptomyces sp. NPDC048527]|uniref:hypothetical protein n=1 Tax=Streptomyces sp. NPDC048527 TaxID=3365568 RepID=UPI00371A9332
MLFLGQAHRRSGPFGAFAEAAEVSFGSHTSLRWSEDHEVRTRADAGCLADITARDLWLATVGSGLHFGKLSTGPAARDLGQADPAVRWSGAALYDGGIFACLTTRPVDDDTYELGITALGQDPDKKLTAQVNDLLHRWSSSGPHSPPSPPTPQPPATTSSKQVPVAPVRTPG